MTSIYLVEDNDVLAELFSTRFTLAGYSVSTYSHGAAFLAAFLAGLIHDLSIIDLCLPDIAGIDVIAAMVQAQAKPSIIAISASPSELSRVAARFPTIPTFCKPFLFPNLLQAIMRLEAEAGQVKAVSWSSVAQ